MSRSALQPEHPPKVTDLRIRQKCEAMIEYGYVALRQFPKFERHVLAAEIRASMWALLPLTTVTQDADGNAIVSTAPGDPAYVVDLAAQAGITVTAEQVAGLLASVDVSDQPPFAAMARLGLKLVQRALP